MDKVEKNYTVISYSVGGKNNMVYKSGDKVKESNFPPGNAEKLVEQGFLKEFTKAQQTKADKAAKAERDAAEQAKKDADAKALEDAENALEEANMAVTIASEKVVDLQSQLGNDGDIDDAEKSSLETELVEAKKSFEIAQKNEHDAKEKLESLKDS